MFGRVLAVAMSVNYIGAPIGSAISGALVPWSLPGTMALAGGLTLASILVAVLTLPKGPAPPMPAAAEAVAHGMVDERGGIPHLPED